ncbi:hypothetical protein ADN00_18875 [Ornatilinea apprima]|uniref:Uncharacterized protein n=1 Tax=Ornatilinea apprima TaxID=1134406 RepID=A0A0P6WK89_9CHLR|nr:hypothetical protein [Ornatilinea apprima]KPL70107.1 hypothetical protein ADN00_18875 [Ornatilinea apprima]
MAAKSDFEIICDQIDELAEAEEDLASNPDQLSMFMSDWNNIIFWFQDIRERFSQTEEATILQKFAAVKPIAEKLKLTWYE